MTEAATRQGRGSAEPISLYEVPTSVFVDSGAYGSCLLSLDNIIRDVNAEFCRILGWERDELIGRHLLEIVHPDDHTQVNRSHAAFRAGGRDSLQSRRRYLSKDGLTVHSLTGMAAIRDTDGKLTGIVKQVQDIGRRVRTERLLQESLARQRMALETLAAGVVVYGADGRIRMANPAACDTLGTSFSELRDGTSGIRLSDEHGAAVSTERQLFPASWSTGEPFTGRHLHVRRADGTTRWIRANARPLVSPGSDDLYTIVSFADITELKQHELHAAL